MNEENQDQITQEADELQEEQKSEVEEETKIDDAETDDIETDDIEAKLQECEDKYLRAYADFENIKKRLEREKYTAVEYASEKFAKELLPVIDTLEMALKVEDKEQFDKFKEGVELTLNKLVDVFEKHEIMQISHEEGFDPNIHEAIMQDSSDEHDDGEIIQVLQQGYRFRERVLRPSLVKINKK
jgi:molecular chaperone GrpE